MATTTPSPSTWTLRFKRGRHTILLFVAPLAPLANVKSSLLASIQDRYASGLPEVSGTLLSGPMKLYERTDEDGETVPSDVPIKPLPEHGELELALLKEANDPASGWVQIDEDDDITIKEAGLRDGGVVAFRWRGEKEWGVRFPSYEDTYAEPDGEGEDGEMS